MKLNELKKQIDSLVEEGYGEHEIRATEPNNSNALWDIGYIGFENILYYDEERFELYNKDILVMYIGDED